MAAVAADAAGVVELVTDADAFVARLTARARKLGLSRAEALLLERTGHGENRWRKPRLLWPLFGQIFGSD